MYIVGQSVSWDHCWDDCSPLSDEGAQGIDDGIRNTCLL